MLLYYHPKLLLDNECTGLIFNTDKAKNESTGMFVLLVVDLASIIVTQKIKQVIPNSIPFSLLYSYKDLSDITDAIRFAQSLITFTLYNYLLRNLKDIVDLHHIMKERDISLVIY